MFHGRQTAGGGRLDRKGCAASNWNSLPVDRQPEGGLCQLLVDVTSAKPEAAWIRSILIIRRPRQSIRGWRKWSLRRCRLISPIQAPKTIARDGMRVSGWKMRAV